MYDIKDVLQILERGDWVSMAVITFDDKRNTGGKVLRLKKCKLLQAPENKSNAIRIRTIDKEARDPNHGEHFTRNIVLQNKKVKKVHIPFIFQINGKQVL